MEPFVLVGRDVPEAGVATGRVVPGLDPVEDRGPGLLPGLERSAAEQLLLERGVEALADGVVVAIALGAHRLRDPGLAQRLAEDQIDVLAALVGVVDQLPGRLPA